MSSNVDAAFVEDVDVDQEIRSRYNASKDQSKAPLYRPESSHKSGARSPAIERVNEDAPLLSPTAQGYGGVGGGDNGEDDGDLWDAPEFRGLPWWKRPSVGAIHYNQHRQDTV